MHDRARSTTAEGLSVAASEGRARVPTGFAIAVVGILLAAKLAYAIGVPPNEDEAYYWQWGQHLALSYFDHPPLVGWMQGIASLLLGWSQFALRATTFVTLAGTALIFWNWAKRLAAPGDAKNFFWTSLAIYLCTPVVFAFTTLAFPDHWLLFVSLASAHFFAQFLGERLEGRAGRYRDLYVGAALLGVAALAKYNAVIMGLALAGFIVFHPNLRPLLRNLNLWLAALLSVAMLMPVVAWNAANGFGSFAFQLYGRYGPGGPGGWGEFSAERFGVFLLTSILYFGPFLIPALLLFLARPAATGFRGAAAGLGRWMFAVSGIAIGGISFFTKGAPHWNILAIVVFLPLAAFHFRLPWLLWTHLVLGTLTGVVLCGYFLVYPLLAVPGDREGPALYGYDQVAARVQALAGEHGAAGLASVFYGGASKLAFAVGPGTDVTALAPTHDSFDDWRNEAALAGRDLIVHDEWGATGLLTNKFESVIHLEDLTVTRFGVPIMRYSLHLGRGYKGLPAP
jgi:hypothetical protein